MKFLWIADEIPYPSHRSGNAKHNALLLERVLKDHDVIYAAPVTQEDRQFIASFPGNVEFFELGSERVAPVVLYLAMLLRGIAPPIFRTGRRIADLLSKHGDAERVYVESLFYAQWFRNHPARKKILNTHDSFNILTESKIALASRFITKLSLRLRKVLYWRFERWLYSGFDISVFVSERDVERLMPRLDDKHKLLCIPLSVDTEYFIPKPDKAEPALIAFTGIMDYEPNRDAATYLARTLFPLIEQQIPSASAVIAGRNADTLLSHLQGPRFGVRGFVEDIRDVIWAASVYVAPLRSGAGMKNKILEAMSCGKAIVASDEAVAGIHTNGAVVICKSDDDYILEIVRLLKTPTERAALGQQARQVVEAEYSVTTMLSRYGNLFFD